MLSSASPGASGPPLDGQAAHAGRGAPVRRYTIAAVGKITPERARTRAKIILGAVAHGHDPANQKTEERGMPTVAERRC
jgi:hypothetical protein